MYIGTEKKNPLRMLLTKTGFPWLPLQPAMWDRFLGCLWVQSEVKVAGFRASELTPF